PSRRCGTSSTTCAASLSRASFTDAMRLTRTWALLLPVMAGGSLGGACGAAPASSAPSATIFTPAHRTTAAAGRDFFGMRPSPSQPVPFPHNVHIAKKLSCTDYCHESAAKGPVAGLPSVKTCMICHSAIATDRPVIRQIAEREQKGIDLAWQRVYGYGPQAHVRFNHAPHVRAGVTCAVCHGNVAQQTVARLNVNL